MCVYIYIHTHTCTYIHIFIHTQSALCRSHTGDSTNSCLKIFRKKNFQEVSRSNLNLLHTDGYLHSICIAFTAIYIAFMLYWGFPGGSEVKASACNVGDLCSIPRSGRSPGEGSGNPLQYSFLENPMDRGAWWATIHGVTKSWTRLSDFTFTFFHLFLLLLHQPHLRSLGIRFCLL